MKRSSRTILVILVLTLFASCTNQFKNQIVSASRETVLARDIEESYWPFYEILQESDPFVSELLKGDVL